jgi:DNA-binding SARP family transcriptional activator
LELLEIRLLGSLELRSRGRMRPFVAPPRTLPLFAYLLLHRGRPIARKALAEALWPDDPPERSRAELRRHLYYLQKALPPARPAAPWIVASHAAVEWNPKASYQVDVDEFLRRDCAGMCSEAVTLYRGELLAGLDDEWLLCERERLGNLYARNLLALIQDQRARRDFGAALDSVRRLLSHDPWREDAIRHLISIRFETGDRAGAIAEFARFAERLRAELGVTPMRETTDCYERIVASGSVTSPHDCSREFSALFRVRPAYNPHALRNGAASAWILPSQVARLIGPTGGEKRSGDVDDTRAQHAAYCTELAARRANSPATRAPSEHAAAFERENYRAALQWALTEQHDVALGRRLTSLLGRFKTGLPPEEVAAAIELSQARCGEAETDYALEGALWEAKAEMSHHFPAHVTLAAAERAVAAYRKHDPDGRLASALVILTRTLSFYFPDRDDVQRAGNEAVSIARSSGNPVQLAAALRARAATIGSSLERRDSYEECLDVLGGSDDNVAIANTFIVMGEFAFIEGRYDDALTCARESLSFSELVDPSHTAVIAMTNLATYAAAIGDFATARSAAVKAILSAREHRRYDMLTWAVQAAAMISLNADDEPRAAAELLGFCDARAGVIHAPRQFGCTEDLMRTQMLGTLNERLGRFDTRASMLCGARLSEA